MDTRELLRRMNNFNKGIVEDFTSTPEKKTTKPQTVRDSLKIVRKLNEFREAPQSDFVEPEVINASPSKVEKTTEFDMRHEEEKMKAFFSYHNVNIAFKFFDVFEDSVFAGGTIDNQIQFIYKVAPSEEESGAKIEYLDSFNPQDEDNEDIVKKVESYYDTFYKYWEQNRLSH